MNEIRFDIQASEYGDVVIPKIDGRSLLSILREVELPFAETEGHASIAGQYAGIPKTVVAPPSDHLLGHSSPEYRWSDKTVLLICECGESGCWPLVVRITSNPGTIEWSDFEQPHRPNWVYDERCMFVFDRTQYEDAIKALA
jgi:hypothetical protein